MKTIGNGIGKFLRMDGQTADLSRPSYARICVEIDLLQPLPSKFWMDINGGKWIDIVYERMPLFCSHCRIQGHVIQNCRKKPRVLALMDKGKQPVIPNPGSLQGKHNHIPVAKSIATALAAAG